MRLVQCLKLNYTFLNCLSINKLFHQTRASPLVFIIYTMFKKIIEKRAVHYNKLRSAAIHTMSQNEAGNVNYQIASMVKIQAEACLSELIIIQNELTLLNFLTK